MNYNTHYKGSTKITCLILIIVFLLFLLLMVIFIAGYFLLQKTYVIPSTNAESVADIITQDTNYGTINGSLGYPSEYIPPMGICAHNTKTKEEFCTYEMIQSPSFMYDLGYNLVVPPGKYTVYAFVAEDENGTPLIDENFYKAYYSEYVTCPADTEICDSHEPIIVTIEKNQTSNNIDPQDWYANL